MKWGNLTYALLRAARIGASEASSTPNIPGPQDGQEPLKLIFIGAHLFFQFTHAASMFVFAHSLFSPHYNVMPEKRKQTDIDVVPPGI
jgi:hypothetical protein